MKQLLILSGKGGTGKTTIAGAFIRLSGARTYADCDVDAPNLHLLYAQDSEPERKDYYGLPKAYINPAMCIKCGQCRKNCRFNAISTDEEYRVDTYACEGCGVCEAICPVKAISLKQAKAGELMLYANRDRVFSTAQLKMGSGTSGMLVTEVKKQLRGVVADSRLAIIDGSPGIGCPVIASISGADMALIVAEPSISGISDMERILRTAAVFGIKTAVCINKYNVNKNISKKIEEFCRRRKIKITGKIPFDADAVKAVNNGISIADVDCASGRAVKEVYNKTMELLFEGE